MSEYDSDACWGVVHTVGCRTVESFHKIETKMEQNVNIILSHTVTCGVITLACVRACVCVCVRMCKLCMCLCPADDHSRVVLDLLGELPGSDYINATWVNVSEHLLPAQPHHTQVC